MLLWHQRQSLLNAEAKASYIGVDCIVEVLFRDLTERRDTAAHLHLLPALRTTNDTLMRCPQHVSHQRGFQAMRIDRATREERYS